MFALRNLSPSLSVFHFLLKLNPSSRIVLYQENIPLGSTVVHVLPQPVPLRLGAEPRDLSPLYARAVVDGVGKGHFGGDELVAETG